MHRLSFRAILLASFLLITASLAAAVAGAWRGMEAVVLAIQEDKQRALACGAKDVEFPCRVIGLPALPPVELPAHVTVSWEPAAIEAAAKLANP